MQHNWKTRGGNSLCCPFSFSLSKASASWFNHVRKTWLASFQRARERERERERDANRQRVRGKGGGGGERGARQREGEGERRSGGGGETETENRPVADWRGESEKRGGHIPYNTEETDMSVMCMFCAPQGRTVNL